MLKMEIIFFIAEIHSGGQPSTPSSMCYFTERRKNTDVDDDACFPSALHERPGYKTISPDGPPTVPQFCQHWVSHHRPQAEQRWITDFWRTPRQILLKLGINDALGSYYTAHKCPLEISLRLGENPTGLTEYEDCHSEFEDSYLLNASWDFHNIW